jgi:RNA polymerase sigma factor for flagellar operon FliA
METTATMGPLPREIAVRFIPIIRQAAYRLARRLPPHVSIDDLVGAGFVGLVDAYRRYDASVCDRFDGYADVRIRGAMIDELRSYDPLSRDLRAFATKRAATVRALETRLGRAPEEAEVAAELGMDPAAYREQAAKAQSISTVSLDGGADDDEPRLEIPDASAERADDSFQHEQSKRTLSLAMDALPPRLRRVLELYYGDELTLRDIGNVLGVSESRICQLHGEAVKRLRASCAEIEAGGADAAPAAKGPVSTRGRGKNATTGDRS